ncbi:unnamed protein product [Lathyrus sativus]|nr:unnamed protein product [Lathyrus sativus]
MVDEAIKSSSHNVIQFDRERFCFMVAKSINQHDGRPLACASIRQDHNMHIPDVFKILSVFKVYSESFLGLPHHQNWPTYEGFTIFHDKTMRRNKKERPNSTRIRTKMDDLEKEKRRREICREIGHMRRKCLNVVGPSNRPV